MGIGPVAPPQFTRERMGIFQRHFSPIRLTNMSNHGTGFDGIVLYQFGDRRIKAGLRIFKCTATLTFIKRNPPAVFVRPGTSPALNQPGEAKANIGWHIGAHPEQFAHISPTLKR
ncbi:hypothetical protein D3C73_1300490 [compost metagenome]